MKIDPIVGCAVMMRVANDGEIRQRHRGRDEVDEDEELATQ